MTMFFSLFLTIGYQKKWVVKQQQKNMLFRIPVSNGDELPAFDHSPFNVIALMRFFV